MMVVMVARINRTGSDILQVYSNIRYVVRAEYILQLWHTRICIDHLCRPQYYYYYYYHHLF